MDPTDAAGSDHDPGGAIGPGPGTTFDPARLGPVPGILEDARRRGFLGPGPVDVHLRHAHAFAVVARRLSASVAHPVVVDLGSGGGLPGLVVAAEWPEVTLILVEGSDTRAGFLGEAVERAALGSRITVVHARAEECGRDPRWRGQCTGVVARSFGAPAVLAECGAPFLRTGGWIVVSEPPEPGPDERAAPRWPALGLAPLGLVPEQLIREPFGLQVLRQASPCPERFPRRNGVPAKRPLF